MMPSVIDKSEVLQAAEYYIGLGWHLTLFDVGTKGPSGIAAKNWNTPSELISTSDRAAQRLNWGPKNIGLCHLPSGTVSIDVDDEAWTRFVFDEFGLDYDSIMGKGMRIFSKENRDKAIFRAPSDLALHKIYWPRQVQRFPQDVFTVFELRAGPNQDVLPPSVHPDGHQYKWVEKQEPWSFSELPEIPVDLLEFWRNYEELKPQIAALCPWKKDAPAVRKLPQRAVSNDHNDLIGKFNRAYSIDEMLKRYGYKKRGKRWLAPSSSTNIPGVVVFDSDKCFSHHGSDILADGHAHDSFDLFVTFEHNGDINSALSECAKEFGVDRGSVVFDPDIVMNVEDMIRNFEQRIEKATKKAVGEVKAAVAEARVEIQEFDEIPDRIKLFSSAGSCGGMLARIQDLMLETAPIPCPEVAAPGAIALLGTVLGRKFCTSTGLRTNTYNIAVAGTGQGKDHPRKINKAFLQSAGLFCFVGGEEIASGQGLLSSVTVNGNRLFQLDEYGLMLQAIASPKAGSHLVAISSSFMKLYSSAGSIMSGTERADQKTHKREDIAFPCVNLFGTTTAEELFPAMSSAQVVNGYANRMLFWFAPKRRQKRRMNACVPNAPEEVVEWFKAAQAFRIGTEGIEPGSPVVVPHTADAAGLLCKWEDELLDLAHGMEANPHLSNLYARAWEHAAKLSLIVAVGKMSIQDLRDCKRPEIDAESTEWAICAARHLLGDMAKIVGERVADTDFEAVCKDVFRVIGNGGDKGRTERELGMYCRKFSGLDPVSRDRVFSVLKRDEKVIFAVLPPASGRGHPRKAWVSAEYENDFRSQKEDGDVCA